MPIPPCGDEDTFPRHGVMDPITMWVGLEWDEHDLKNCTIESVAIEDDDPRPWPIFEHWMVDQKLIQYPSSTNKDWRGYQSIIIRQKLLVPWSFRE